MKNFERSFERGGERIKRISVALDPETFDALYSIIKRRRQTISEVVRSAIMHYYEKESRGYSDIENLEICAELLAGGGHVVVDLELWIAMLNELNDKASEEFWRTTRKEGYRHGIYYKNVGITNLEDVLRHSQVKNWYKLRAEKNCYLLIFSAQAIRNFLRTYLEGLFEALSVDVDITEGMRSFMITERKPIMNAELL